MAQGKQINWSLDIVLPTETVLADAKRFQASDNQDLRDVSKALLDVTSVATKVQEALRRNDSNGQFDLAPFFDYWFGDSLDIAARLKDDSDKGIRNIAKCLLAIADGIQTSKEGFLKEVKRVTT